MAARNVIVYAKRLCSRQSILRGELHRLMHWMVMHQKCVVHDKAKLFSIIILQIPDSIKGLVVWLMELADRDADGDDDDKDYCYYGMFAFCWT